MSNLEFLVLLSNNFFYFIILLLSTFGLIYITLKKYIHSVFDPIFYQYVLISFASTVPIFLFVTNNMSLNLFVYFLFSMTIFLIILSFNKPCPFQFSNQIPYSFKNELVLFLICFSLVVGIKMFEYITGGIPIFMESRFANRQNFVLSILNRMVSVPKIFCTLFLFNMFKKSVPKKIKILFLLPMLILFSFDFLGGSKGFILKYIFLFFIFKFFYQKRKFHLSKFYLLLLSIFPIIVVNIYYGTRNVGDSVIMLLFRIVASGDTYWQGFPNDIISQIDNCAPWYERAFSFVLGPLGLVSDNAKIPIGTLILAVENKGYLTTLEGGNSLLPLLTYVCCNWYGLLLTIFYALLCKTVFNICSYLSVPCDLVGCSVLAKFYLLGITMINDPILYSSQIIDIVFGIIFFNVFSFLFCKSRGLIKLKTTLK